MSAISSNSTRSASFSVSAPTVGKRAQRGLGLVAGEVRSQRDRDRLRGDGGLVLEPGHADVAGLHSELVGDAAHGVIRGECTFFERDVQVVAGAAGRVRGDLFDHEIFGTAFEDGHASPFARRRPRCKRARAGGAIRAKRGAVRFSLVCLVLCLVACGGKKLPPNGELTRQLTPWELVGQKIDELEITSMVTLRYGCAACTRFVANEVIVQKNGDFRVYDLTHRTEKSHGTASPEALAALNEVLGSADFKALEEGPPVGTQSPPWVEIRATGQRIRRLTPTEEGREPRARPPHDRARRRDEQRQLGAHLVRHLVALAAIRLLRRVVHEVRDA